MLGIQYCMGYAFHLQLDGRWGEVRWGPGRTHRADGPDEGEDVGVQQAEDEERRPRRRPSDEAAGDRESAGGHADGQWTAGRARRCRHSRENQKKK